MKKGIVLKRQDHHWIVMTPDGRFHKIRSDGRDVIEGEEIEFALPEEQRVRTMRRPWRNVTYAAAACLLLLLSGIPLWNLLFTTAYAAVSIDINPSFELEVNKQYQVTDLQPLNEEAQTLAPSIAWKDRELTAVTSDIIRDAKKSGFLKQNQDILIVPVGLDNADASQEVLHKIEQQASALAQQGGEGVTVTLMKGTKEAREAARKEGMSVGKYALYDSVRHMDHSISADQIKKLSITEISSAIGGIDRVPNAKHYTSQPAHKPDATPKPAVQPEVKKTTKQTVIEQADKVTKVETSKRDSVSSKKENHRPDAQESGPKTKVIPKAVVEETKRKAAAQEKKESGRTEEEKKYKSEYGQLQQEQNQAGQAADDEEKKRNDSYKKEREKKQPHFSDPLQDE